MTCLGPQCHCPPRHARRVPCVTESPFAVVSTGWYNTRDDHLSSTRVGRRHISDATISRGSNCCARMLVDPALRSSGSRSCTRPATYRASSTSRSARRRRRSAPAGRCEPTDVITSTHRGHAHCLAKGLDPLSMFAELMGQPDGSNRGPRRVDAHRRPDARRSSAPTASWPPGCPSPPGRHRRPAQGNDASPSPSSATARSPRARSTRPLNLAAVWRLPVIFFCENNGYAEFSACRRPAPPPRSSSGRPGTGSPYASADGNDVVAVVERHDAARRRRARGRRPADRRGRHLPLARPLRGRPSAVPRQRGGDRAAAGERSRSTAAAATLARRVTVAVLDATRIGRSRARRRRSIERACAAAAGGPLRLPRHT